MAQIQPPEFARIAEQLLTDANTYASVTALNFFKESFTRQGWLDRSIQPWEPVAGKNGQGIMINTAFLRDSIQIVSRTSDRIEFNATAPYASIHNNGGIITVRVTPKSRRFFWFMFKATGQKKWKYMAMAKADRMTIKIPKRQFIGESWTLNQELDKWFIQQIVTRFNQA